MTGKLNVDPAQLRQAANAFDDMGNQIKGLTNSMTDTVRQITGDVWSGDAASTYVNKFNGLQDDIDRMIRKINEHVADLNAMARTYEETENKNQELANTLQVDAIS